MQDYQSLSDQSKVWIYQSNRPFSEEETSQIRSYVQQFAQQWVSHNRQLKAYGEVYHQRFIVLMVDETAAGASGCSIDKSVHFMKQIEQKFGVDLFDRMRFSVKGPDGIKTISRDTFADWYANGQIDNETIVFDTLVADKAAFDQSFEKSLGESWHKRMV